ncbi:transposase [Streptomyces achmelvichensis]|uniref:transposase n=1 Tax=Streptomyces achmelvichensis TaxID=3134111 RepID=UPI003C12B7B2
MPLAELSDSGLAWTWTIRRLTAPRQGVERGLTSALRLSADGRPGSKHHVIVDRHGTPLAASPTRGNRHDVTQLIPLLESTTRVAWKPAKTELSLPRPLSAFRWCIGVLCRISVEPSARGRGHARIGTGHSCRAGGEGSDSLVDDDAPPGSERDRTAANLPYEAAGFT